MATRNFQQFQRTLEKGLVTLYANIPIGATGAVGTLVASKNQGIYSVTRTSTGLYNVFFGISAAIPDKYVRCLSIKGTIVNSTVDAVGAVNIKTDNSATGSVIIFTQDFAGSVVDPANGAVLLLEIVLKNSSI